MESYNIENLTRDEILNLRFPFKILTIIKKPNEIIQWGRNGTTVLIDIRAFEKYLLSESSIFKTKNLSSFIRQMNLYGFQKINQPQILDNISNSNIHEYQNDNFKQNNVSSIHEILRKSGNNRQRINLSQDNGYFQKQKKIDPCSFVIPKQSKISIARENLRLILHSKSINSQLKSKKEVKIPIYEISNDLYSKLLLKIPKYNVSGFYGNPEVNVDQYFADYIPNVSNSSSDIVEFPVEEINKNPVLISTSLDQMTIDTTNHSFQNHTNQNFNTTNIICSETNNNIPNEFYSNVDAPEFSEQESYLFQSNEYNIDEYITFKSPIEPTTVDDEIFLEDQNTINEEMSYLNNDENEQTTTFPGANMPILNDESETIVDNFYRQIRASIDILYDSEIL